MSHKKSVNKRLAAERAHEAAGEKDITSNSTNVQAKRKKNK